MRGARVAVPCGAKISATSNRGWRTSSGCSASHSSAVARKSAKRAASFRSELLYGVGHYPHIEDPEAVADQIRGLF